MRKFGPPALIGNDGWWNFTFNTSLNNAFMSMQFAATSLGLGTQWVSAYRNPEVDKKVKALLEIPEHLEVYEMMALGYQRGKSGKKRLRDPKSFTHYNKADNYRTQEEVDQWYAK